MLKHVIMDVDGVLNTGHFFYSADGKMFKAFGPHDKDGINIMKSLGLTINFITADVTGWCITYARIVTDWGFSPDNLHLVTECNRLPWIENQFNFDELVYIADGYHDVPILRKAKLSIAPASARREARLTAIYVTESNAGNGAILDAALFIKSQM